jgi:hypothetical protein
MITADQLLAHAIGDYVLQSDWMANEKTKKSVAAFAHALVYSLCFVVFRPSYGAFTVILATHFIIDRWRLARYVVYAKNFISPQYTTELKAVPNSDEASSPAGYVWRYGRVPWWYNWSDCIGTGYHRERPAWLAVWLLIIADNVMHVLINGLALRYLS